MNDAEYRPRTSAPGNDTPVWHGLSVEETATALTTAIDVGLTDQEASARQIQFGENAVRESESRSIWAMIGGQLFDFMILVLLAAAVLAGVVGEFQDSIAIIVIVVLNAVVGVAQEWRAERALESLRSMTAPTARILRGGTQRVVPATEIVPGDVVLVTEGDIVPADVRLIEAAALRTDESMLTGESSAIDKIADFRLSENIPIGDRVNMAFKGTNVAHGRGVGIAVATGMATELGRIASMIEGSPRIRTPLQRRLSRFGKILGLAVIALCAVIFFFGLLRGEEPLLMFLTAISLAVAAVPEALPAVVTVALALGAYEMMRQNALVRALPAVETLGSVTTICADKTGTLTQNRMRVDSVAVCGLPIDLGAIAQREGPVDSLLTAMALCNDVNTDANGQFIGDPTEVAIATYADDAGYARVKLEADLPRIDEIPFDADRKRMATVHRSGDGLRACIKGAPEAVLPLCRTSATAAANDGAFALADRLAEAERMAEQGLRVIAIAERRWDDTTHVADVNSESIEQELTFLGLVGLLDPPREEARQAVADCRQAGITPVMITGDHPATAQRIGLRLGIVSDGETVVSGGALRQMADTELAARVSNIRIYARAEPAQKIRIVQALQKSGEIVAMTGDGVNDAPALKRANIGVAMGRGGTDVAREASSLVLLDDNFATIVGAVRAGRRIYDNIRKFIKYTMTSNSGEIATIFFAPFLGMPIPLLPIHILWINLVTDGLPGLALAAEPEDDDTMRRPPRPSDESIFARGMWQHVLWCGLTMAAICLATQAWALSTGREDAWQTMVFTVLTLSQMGHVLTIRSELEPMISKRFFANRMLLLAVGLTFTLQLAVIYAPGLNAIFKTVPLSAADLFVCIALSSIIAILVEIEKALARRGLIYAK